MNKRGSAIAGAVMVFPVVILTVAALICIMTYFYKQLNDRVDMHIMLRAEGGSICGNMYYSNVNERDFSIYKEAQQIYSSYVTVSDADWMLMGRKKEIGARKYLVDESDFVRMTSVIGDDKSENQ